MKNILVIAATFATATVANAVAEPSLMAMRLRAPHTADDAQWAKTFKVLCENHGACDEVWFSTGVAFPNIAWHEDNAKRLSRYAEQLRTVGIIPSLQIQATIGHDDSISLSHGGCGGKTWRGFTGRGGTECKGCNCPRQPGFIAYMREVARLYASFRPGSVWIDDDLRIMGHAPGSPWNKAKDGWIGCWCNVCIEAFNAQTNGTWTRETIDAAMSNDSALFDRWEKFSFDGIAAVARAIAEAVHEVSPETRLAYQHGSYRNDSQLAVFRALHEATGLPVGSRPGGGAYYDTNPNVQMVKALDAIRQRRCLGDAKWIDVWCAEVETWPRAFASRTAQGVLNEAFVNLAMGMNSISLLIMDSNFETDEWYGENLLAPLAAERPLFEAYRRHNAGTFSAGFADATSATSEGLYNFALAGVPVLSGPGKACGTIEDADLSFRIESMSSSKLMELRSRFDERCGGRTPVVVETPSVGLVIPRVAADGTLRSVALVNSRIDVQRPVRLRLRNVPSGVKSATWRAFHQKPEVLPVERLEGGDAAVTVPPLSAWNCGWLAIEYGCHAEPMRVALTFDDSLKDHLLIAAPLLEERGWRGTFNLVTDRVGSGEKYLTWDDVRELVRRGHEVATHTKTHCDLLELLNTNGEMAVKRELAESRDAIAKETGFTPRFLCSPLTRQDDVTARLCREEGLRQMLGGRVNFGQGSEGRTRQIIESRIASGEKRLDVLHHGITADGHGGWRPFCNRQAFERHLDDIAALEREGKIVVTDYDGMVSDCSRSVAETFPLPPRATAVVTNAAAVMEAKVFNGANGGSLRYRMLSPATVEVERKYPLVLFLHGAGERGDDNAMQLLWGVWPLITYMRQKGIEGYMIVPQCPAGKQWVDTPWSQLAHKMLEKPSEPMALVMELLDNAIKELPIDAGRVSVTGLSMGGYGTWDIVQRRPEVFAAAMPVCGGGDPSLAWKIRSVPIWTFHGDKDDAVPVVRSRQMVSALWQCDGNVRYREYPGVGHGCWIATYNDNQVLDWFFSQSKPGAPYHDAGLIDCKAIISQGN